MPEESKEKLPYEEPTIDPLGELEAGFLSALTGSDGQAATLPNCYGNPSVTAY